MTPEYAAVVAGGGPAGATAALVLARRGLRVLLADAARRPAFRVGEALPPAARPLLRDLGVLDRVLADGHLPSYGNVAAWGASEPHAHDFVFDPNGHGWHLDRARFDASLRDAARDAGADVHTGIKITGATRPAGEPWHVTLEGNTTPTVRCDWLIDATGRAATLARRLGATRRPDDALVAFYARFRAATPDHDARTMIESAPDGWWYTALLPGGERVVAFLTDADLADRRALLSATGFEERLRDSRLVRGVLAARGYAPISRPRGTDAGSARLDRLAGDGWIAVGDAALSFDPLSSQGLLTALYTGLRGGEAGAGALGGDVGRVEGYTRRLDEVYGAYLRNRHAYYAAETRWRDRPFWRRRRL